MSDPAASSAWRTSRRVLEFGARPLVMAIVNVTPDSFSDGGKIQTVDDALKQVERYIGEGADIIDVGGESTRPGSKRVDADEEISRVVPVVDAIVKRFDIPVSVDTSKAAVARQAVEAGAEIINDISGLRWEPEIAEIAVHENAGLILMHSRGAFDTMHDQPAVRDILSEVSAGLRASIETARRSGVSDENIALDIGIGFGKSFEQNLELIANLDKIVNEFEAFPVLVGASRKSFIGKLLGGAPPASRLGGSLAAAIESARRGCKILRVHDVAETVSALTVVSAFNANRR